MTAALLAKSLPYANGFELTRTVRGRSGQPANGFEPVRTTPPVEDIGSTHDFWTYDFAAKKNVKTTATLRLMTDHAKWWVANDANVDLNGLRTTATAFENRIYPTDRDVYLRTPDTQLNDWADLDTARPHYGLAYMFLDYLRQHAGGDDLVRALMQKGIDTPEDFDAVLKQRGQAGVEEQWLNFVAANSFIGMSTAPPYGYPQGAPGRQPAAVVVGDKVEAGGTFQSTVHEYSVRYVDLPRARITLRFGGPTSNRLIATDPHSGRSFWWSDRGDGMDATLTKTFDFRATADPKLAFWTWYGIEADYDYAYVEASTDGGSHWTPLRTEASSATDPNGQNLGNGITGSSSGETATG